MLCKIVVPIHICVLQIFSSTGWYFLTVWARRLWKGSFSLNYQVLLKMCTNCFTFVAKAYFVNLCTQWTWQKNMENINIFLWIRNSKNFFKQCSTPNVSVFSIYFKIRKLEIKAVSRNMDLMQNVILNYKFTISGVKTIICKLVSTLSFCRATIYLHPYFSLKL